VKAYEKLERYDEALTLLDDITGKVNLSEIGKQRFREIRARLMAAKDSKSRNPYRVPKGHIDIRTIKEEALISENDSR